MQKVELMLQLKTMLQQSVNSMELLEEPLWSTWMKMIWVKELEMLKHSQKSTVILESQLHAVSLEQYKTNFCHQEQDVR